MSRTDVHIVDSAGKRSKWTPTTLADCKKQESFLEEAIAHDFSILALAAHGIHLVDIKIFRQVQLLSPEGNLRKPDIVAVSRTGDLVVVEAKRSSNAELYGRAVVAQVVDYVATAASTSEADLLRAFGSPATNWEEFARQAWPEEPHVEWFAASIRRKLKEGHVCLVIACDRAPDGLVEIVQAVANQQALAFELRVVEITPFVCAEQPGTVMLQAHHAVETKVIHRTVVTIRNEAGSDRVTVQVAADDADKIAQNIAQPAKLSHMASLDPVAAKLGLSVQALVEELNAIHAEAVEAEWPLVDATVLRQGEQRGAYLHAAKPPGFVWGRFGVNLVRQWWPSVVVAAMIDGRDHSVPLCRPADGADFAVFLSNDYSNVRKPEYRRRVAEAMQKTRHRLALSSPGWQFHDTLASAAPQYWHPIFLRKPLIEVFEGTSTAAERRDRWFSAANEGLRLLLRDDEISELRAFLDQVRK